MRIAMCAAEVVPFAKTGGLADVLGALPVALEKLGEDVIVIMPGYKCAHSIKNLNVKNFKDGISYSTIGKSVTVYFIDHDKYFNREGLYGDKSGDYPDNLDRFSYFCKRSLELLKDIDFCPDIIHCHDWQAGLIPVYLKTLYAKDKYFENTKTILTIHNLGYQGIFDKDQFHKLGIEAHYFNMEQLEFFDSINILKGGIVFSDMINTVSPTYSKEIQTQEYGFGLEGVLRKRRNSLSGILNGLDYSTWDPIIDKYIAKKFSAKSIANKEKNKADLQKECGFAVKKNVPVVGIVSRIAAQKGFDILAESLETICKMDLQLVVLGTGDIVYHRLLEKMVKKYPKVISAYLKFDEVLAHKIYAGSDIFLMPSMYEPCGLSQMISLKYGTIPLVFKTGGLIDTVNAANGFLFDKYTKDDLIKSVVKAVTVFKSKVKWDKLVVNAMKCDFSWSESAKKYIELYEKTTG